MAYHVEHKTKRDLEDKIQVDIKRKITLLEADLEQLNRIKTDKLTDWEKDKLVSKQAKVDRLKNIDTEIDRVILAKEYKSEAVR